MTLNRSLLWVRPLVTLCALMVASAGCGKGEGEASRLVGKWRYAGSSTSQKEDTSASVTYKLVTQTGWSLTEVTKATGQVTKSSGGTYTLIGDTYTEHVDYGAHKGETIAFKCKIDGDKWYHTGKLPDTVVVDSASGNRQTEPGFPIDEVWVREK